MSVEPATQWAAASEEFEQNQAGGDWRHDEREGNECFDDRFAKPTRSREQPGEAKAERQNERRAQRAGEERKPRRLPFIGREPHQCFTTNPKRSKTSVAEADLR